MFLVVGLTLESVRIHECSCMLCSPPSLSQRTKVPGQESKCWAGCKHGKQSHRQKAAFTGSRLRYKSNKVLRQVTDIKCQCLQTILRGFRVKHVASLGLVSPLKEILKRFVGGEAVKPRQLTSVAHLEEIWQAQKRQRCS